jgi:Carboxypeptidase regulatory-like domain
MSRMLKAVAYAAIAALLSPASHGQEKRFDIHGSVVALGDQRSANAQGLPNVKVWLRRRGLGDERETVTDEHGTFSFAGLPAGRYVLQVGRESVTVPLSSFLEVDLNVDSGLTLLLPLHLLYDCPDGIIPSLYFRQLDAGSDQDLATLSGAVKGKDGTPVEGATVTLYVPKLGRMATTRTKRGGSFSFDRLKIDENYWIRVVSEGYFDDEINRLKVLAGYESVYGDLTLEPCQPGQCEASLRQSHIMPGCG